MACFISLVLLTLASASLFPSDRPSVDSAACFKYMCKPDAMNFDSSTCIFLSKNTYYLNECPMNSYCPYTNFTPSQNVTCLPTDPKQLSEPYPGEPCDGPDDCIFGTCTDNVCVGQNRGQYCSDFGQCNPGLYCRSNICEPQLKIGQKGCSGDFDCVNNAGCLFNKTGSYCVEYFSMQEGDTVSNCDEESGLSLLCASRTCKVTSKSKGECVLAYKSLSTLPVMCSDDSDCSASNGISEVTTRCICGVNPEGSSYCLPAAGDAPGVRFGEAFARFIHTNAMVHCNTARRFSPDCWAESLSVDAYEQLVITYYAYQYYPELQNNDFCAFKIFHEQYVGSSLALILSGFALFFI